ncbi:hypothetical protein M885DRAFT_612586 [Pelagophyceae sp. CCMP2097]|nr:hypothetical protein M885DRAFT_612586 [Pelagophyceae sp. CCMP2097]
MDRAAAADALEPARAAPPAGGPSARKATRNESGFKLDFDSELHLTVHLTDDNDAAASLGNTHSNPSRARPHEYDAAATIAPPAGRGRSLGDQLDAVSSGLSREASGRRMSFGPGLSSTLDSWAASFGGASPHEPQSPRPEHAPNAFRRVRLPDVRPATTRLS